MSAATWVAVGAVGGAGSVARVYGTLLLGRGVPWRGTLAVNLIGAFLLGVLAGCDVRSTTYLIAGTGLLGAFTTFSTWMHECLALWQGGRRSAAAALLLGALVAGLVAAAAGRAAGVALS
ncbi:Putative fluoride ion transporter CrcB [Paraconexibacter sp. AEG42_29]|uniref:Fluoride-specific ion channel FluC n=1 Tax=Paraconexibacter sp. AEG42_29 TaxID=2997339 RepID=A0AAU7AZN2_9ACTN